MLRKEALKAFLIFKKIQFPEIKGKFTIIMRRRPSEDQGCLLVRHLFYSMSQIPFMVGDGGQRFIRIPGEKLFIANLGPIGIRDIRCYIFTACKFDNT